MAKLSGGILGPIKGRVGAVVGAVVGGQNIVKSMPASYNDKKSESQITHRSTFANALVWYQALVAAVNEGFRERLAIHSPYNSFMSANVGTGIITETPVWDNLKVSKGSLTNPNFEMNTTSVNNQLSFTWDDDSDGNSKLATDKVCAVVIEPVSKEVFVNNTGATRATGGLTVTIPSSMVGKTVQTYCFVVRTDGKKASTSKRTGHGIAGSDLAGSVL